MGHNDDAIEEWKCWLGIFGNVLLNIFPGIRYNITIIYMGIILHNITFGDHRTV
jgi:hypothetical protein